MECPSEVDILAQLQLYRPASLSRPISVGMVRFDLAVHQRREKTWCWLRLNPVIGTT